MEVEKEPEHKIKKRTSSATKFHKTFPTFVVAFSLKETYDDLATAQQMICNKYSPQDSVNSITPTNSVKSVKNVANELADKLEQVSAAAELQKTKENKDDTIIIEENTVIAYQGDIEVTNKKNTVITTDIPSDEITYRDNTETTCQENNKSNIFPLVDSLKIITNDQIEEIEQILDYSLSTEYSVEEDRRESNAIYLGNSQEQVSFNNEVENPITDVRFDNEKIEMDETPKTDNCKKIEIETVENDPETMFAAPKHHKRKETKFPKRNIKKYKTDRKIYFKPNDSRNIIHTRIDRYYNKKKINFMHPKQIKKELYADSNTTIISRNKVLKNVAVKENLIEEIDLTYVKNTSSNASVVSVPSTTKKSCISNASDNTLTRKDSRILQKEEDVDTVNSVIEIPPEKIYNSDVIVAAAAIAYDINDNTTDNTIFPNQDTFMNLQCLTSTDTLKALDQDSPLTSNSNPLTTNSEPLTSNSDPLTSNSQQNEVSQETLINNESNFEVSSSYEAYYNAKTSSEFRMENDADYPQIYNAEPSSEFRMENDADYPQIYEAAFHQINEKKKRSLLNTVINLGMYPDTPSTSSAATNENVENNVIVTDVKKYSYDSQYVDETYNQDLNNKALKKTNITRTKTVILPNHKNIQALINENEMLQQKCAEEARNLINANDILWERLVPIIDQAMKRLESTLIDKIIEEFKKSLSGYEFFKRTSRKIGPNRDVEMMSGDVAVYNKEVSTTEVKTETEQGLQCDLIHNNIIDEIMKKLSSVDRPQIISTTSKSFPKIKPNTFENVVEVLKPPLSPIVIEKGETVTISTLTRGSEYQTTFSRLTTMFRPPVNFLRENGFVLTSVPAFFIVLLCLYGLILLILNPW